MTATGITPVPPHAVVRLTEPANEEPGPQHDHDDDRGGGARGRAAPPVESRDDDGQQRGEPRERPYREREDAPFGDQGEKEDGGHDTDHEQAAQQDLPGFAEFPAQAVVAHDVLGEHRAQRQRLRVERRHDRGEDPGTEQPGEKIGSVEGDHPDQDRTGRRTLEPRKVDVPEHAQQHARDPHHDDAHRVEHDRGLEGRSSPRRKPVREDVRERPHRQWDQGVGQEAQGVNRVPAHQEFRAALHNPVERRSHAAQPGHDQNRRHRAQQHEHRGLERVHPGGSAQTAARHVADDHS